MRRFSQRNQLVTLNEINITPLLDLAFVLLIIFIITTPLLEGSIDLKLPGGGNSRSSARASDVVTVEVSPAGVYFFNRTRLPNEGELEKQLIAALRRNSNVVVSIRASADGPYRLPASILDMCQRNGLYKFKLNTDDPRR